MVKTSEQLFLTFLILIFPFISSYVFHFSVAFIVVYSGRVIFLVLQRKSELLLWNFRNINPISTVWEGVILPPRPPSPPYLFLLILIFSGTTYVSYYLLAVFLQKTGWNKKRDAINSKLWYFLRLPDKICYFSVLCEKCLQNFSGPNKGKYGPEKIPYLDTFLAVR